MQWSRTSAPAIVKTCDCGSEIVEVKPDGLVKAYRCAECHASLGDLTMGQEP